MNNIRNIVIIILAIVAIYMLYENSTHVNEPMAVIASSENPVHENVAEYANIEDYAKPLVDLTDMDFKQDLSMEVPKRCSCGCVNCKCNPETCRCGKIMNASDQYAIPIQGKGMLYDCGCGCGQKDAPSLSVSNPEFLNEWANFRSNSYQNSNNMQMDTVDLIQQMYVDDNQMPSRKYKGKTVAEVFDKLTNKDDFMRCVRVPDFNNENNFGINPYDPYEN